METYTEYNPSGNPESTFTCSLLIWSFLTHRFTKKPTTPDSKFHPCIKHCNLPTYFPHVIIFNDEPYRKGGNSTYRAQRCHDVWQLV
jgi:hypothetical protein